MSDCIPVHAAVTDCRTIFQTSERLVFRLLEEAVTCWAIPCIFSATVCRIPSHAAAVLVFRFPHAWFRAVFTLADAAATVFVMPLQLWVNAVCTPCMEFVIAFDKVLDRLLAAFVTTDTLLLMPSARPFMKSGIQLSKSVRGPSSGTEK